MINVAPNNHPLLFSVGINHRTAPLEVRERMSVSEESLPELLNKFKPILDECMIISTCNRTELYGVASGHGLDTELIKQMLIDYKSAGAYVKSSNFYEYILGSATEQLFKVATSIDSMVVGDSQVMHQVKNSYQIAYDNGSTGKVLNQLIQKALHTGKKVKSDTKLFEGAFSVSYAAVELAMKIFGDLRDMTAMVIGAGETAELTIESLIKKNIKKVYVTNRTKANADKLLEKLSGHMSFEGQSIEFTDFKNKLNETDIVISSTGSNDHILTYDEFKQTAKKRRGAPILIIDIAVPRDIDPKIDKFGEVFLKNMDDLNAIVDTNYEKRMAVVPEVKSIISREVLEFLLWYYMIPVLPTIQHIQTNFNGKAAAEIRKIRETLVARVTEFHQNIIMEGVTDQMVQWNSHETLMNKLEELNETRQEL